MRIRVLLVDDHPMFRDGLAAFLTKDRRFEISGAVGTIEDAVEILETASRERQPIDFVLLDVSLSTVNSIVAIPRLRKVSERTRIIMLSMHNSPSLVRSALDAGARGFLSKVSAGTEVVAAIEAVQNGETYIDPVMQEMLAHTESSIIPEESVTERYGRLSRREQEVFRALALGDRPRKIAQRLGIAKRTADAHRYHIMQKMEVENLADLVRIAVELGIVDRRTPN